VKIFSLTCAGAVTFLLLVIGATIAFQDSLPDYNFDLAKASTRK
jgi:hypothetical protein